jgi:hypothetical protein
MLFGGIDEGALECIRDRAGAKIIGTLSKSVGFPKLEADISGYRRQHIVGSLFYSNFKVKFLLLGFFYFCDEAKFSDVGLFLQSMLLSKALRMQQDFKDKKNEIIIEGLENKIRITKLLWRRKTSYFKQKKARLQKSKLKMLD